MPTITGPTTDGSFYASGSWQTIRDASSASSAGGNGGTKTWDWLVYDAGSALQRSFFVFDTSSVSAPPSSATLKIHRHFYTSGNPNLGATVPDIIAVKSDANFNLAAPLVNTDWDNIVGFSPGNSMSGAVTDYSSVFTAASWPVTETWCEIPLNAAACADMASQSLLKIAIVIHSTDYLNVNVHPVIEGILARFGDMVGSEPYIDYTAGGGSGGSGPGNSVIKSMGGGLLSSPFTLTP